MNKNEVLVIGATGAMGRAVIRSLLGDSHADWQVRALTRDAGGKVALALKADGGARLDLVVGDVNDKASLAAAMEGVSHVFCNTDFFSSLSPAKEFEQGIAVLESAKAARVEMLVYSSLDAAAGLSRGRVPVPHYDAKAAVESRIDLMRSEEFMQREPDGFYSQHVGVLVTGPYFENFQSFFRPQSGVLNDGRTGLIFNIASGTADHPMIALDDIGAFARIMLSDRRAWGGKTLRVIGEALTGSEIAASFERVTQVPAEWRDVPFAVLEQSIPGIGHDLANMHRFFQEIGIAPRDAAELRRIHPQLMGFEQWLQTSGWKGEAGDVQKMS